MLQFNAPAGQQAYRNSVKAIGSRLEVAPRDPRDSRQGDGTALSPSDGLQRMSKRRPAAAFYFHKRDEFILFHDEVDLLTEEANVTIQDSPTPLLQVALGQRFEATSATYVVQE